MGIVSLGDDEKVIELYCVMLCHFVNILKPTKLYI